MKRSNVRQSAIDTQKEIIKLDALIELSKTDMALSVAQGDKRGFKKSKLEYDNLIVQKQIKEDLLEKITKGFLMDKMVRV